jgi:Tol biopolymer transport system component
MRRKAVAAVLGMAWALVGMVVSAAPARASFPGSNGLIVWSRLFLTRDAELFVMNPDGSGEMPLTHNDRTDFDPAWSADGTQIAYASSTADDVDIWVSNADGTHSRNVSNDPGVADTGPAWAPDGSVIAFAKLDPFTGLGNIWVMSPSGANQTQLTFDTDATNSQPSWSWDGKLIVFTSNRDGNQELYTIVPDGTGLTRLTFTPDMQEENPNWSPDTELIAFDACHWSTYPCPGSPNYDIATIRKDGTGRHKLTNDPSIDANPAWSPDQTQIVFRSDRTGETQLWKMNADGSGLTQLTFDSFEGGVDPDWQAVP